MTNPAPIPTKAFHAIEACLLLATATAPMPTAAITHALNLPYRYLEAALQQLRREGILSGERGPSGGYRLARATIDITALEIVRAAATRAVKPRALEPATLAGKKAVLPLYRDLEAAVQFQLGVTTLSDLVDRARGVSLPTKGV